VTALISQATLDPLAPVIASLARMGARHGKESLQGLSTGLVTQTPGWRSAAELLTGEGVGDWLAAAEGRWSAQPHAAAALAWKCYSYWLALPAVIGFATSRRVPLMTPDHVLVRFSERQPFLTLALRRPVTAVLATDPIVASETPGLLIVEDEDELLGVLRRSLVDAHLDPMLDEVRKQARLSRRTLWGSVASGVAYAMSRGFPAPPGTVLDTTYRVLHALSADDLVELSVREGGGLDVKRRTCCLAFTLPTPKVCSGCCIRQ
jgi:ferric iron reductase protein FhuF